MTTEPPLSKEQVKEHAARARSLVNELHKEMINVFLRTISENSDVPTEILMFVGIQASAMTLFGATGISDPKERFYRCISVIKTLTDSSHIETNVDIKKGVVP